MPPGMAHERFRSTWVPYGICPFQERRCCPRTPSVHGFDKFRIPVKGSRLWQELTIYLSISLYIYIHIRVLGQSMQQPCIALLPKVKIWLILSSPWPHFEKGQVPNPSQHWRCSFFSSLATALAWARISRVALTWAPSKRLEIRREPCKIDWRFKGNHVRYLFRQSCENRSCHNFHSFAIQFLPRCKISAFRFKLLQHLIRFVLKP